MSFHIFIDRTERESGDGKTARAGAPMKTPYMAEIIVCQSILPDSQQQCRPPSPWSLSQESL